MIGYFYPARATELSLNAAFETFPPWWRAPPLDSEIAQGSRRLHYKAVQVMGRHKEPLRHLLIKHYLVEFAVDDREENVINRAIHDSQLLAVKLT